jgi:hypothetical protein
MSGGNFKEELDVDADGIVMAEGPLDATVEGVTVMCVWVVQPDGIPSGQASPSDAIGNNMGGPGEMPDMGDAARLTVSGLGTDSARWQFPLVQRFDSAGFRDGSATAQAVGVFVIDGGRQRTFSWEEAVQLKLSGPKGA